MRNKDFSISWGVSDGYADGRRPQTTYIEPGDIDPGMTLKEIEEIIFDAVQEDFNQNVSPGYSFADVQELAERLLIFVSEENDES